MKTRNSNFGIVIIVTLLVAGLVWGFGSTEPLKNERFFSFPLEIGEWHGRDIPMSDYVFASIETPYLMLRDYSSSRYSYPVNLSIVWFDDTNIAFHAPEACLGGVSNEVKMQGTVNVRLAREHDLKKFISNLNGKDYLVLYFFDVDGIITTRQSIVRMQVLFKRLLFRRSSASFIRLMAPLQGKEQDTLVSLLEFLREMYPFVPEYLYTDLAVFKK